MPVFPYKISNADYTHIHIYTHTFIDFRYNENKLVTQLKLVLGKSYEYHIQSDASIYRMMLTKALN